MKHLKTYNQLNERSFTRDVKYLKEKDTIKMREYAVKYFDRIILLGLIKNLNYDHFEKEDYDSYKIFEDYLIAGYKSKDERLQKFFAGNPERIEFDSIWTYCYYNMNDYLKTLHNDFGGTPAIHNTLDKIVLELYKEYKIEDKLVDRFIRILKEDSKKFLERMKDYEKYFSTILMTTYNEESNPFSEDQISFDKKFREKMKDYFDAKDMGLL